MLVFFALLLVAGMIAGFVFPGRLTDVFGTATLYIFLPTLIFEGAWKRDRAILQRVWAPIALLAIPGVLITAAIIAIVVHYAGRLAWPPALILGAILSATDPVAVLAIFRRLSFPKPLTTIVESEALLNDAVAVVLYRAVLAAAAFAAFSRIEPVALGAVVGTILGIICGAVVGAIAIALLRVRSGGLAYIVLTLLGAYGSYYLANRFDWSGIFAVLTFGVIIGWSERHRLKTAVCNSIERFWSATALFANAVLFFLIGAALDPARLGPALPIAIVTIAAVVLARVVITHGLLQLSRPRLQIGWITIVRMAGIRGALSLALAIATPIGFPNRNIVIDATFIVVVVTLLAGIVRLGGRGDVLVNHVQNDLGR